MEYFLVLIAVLAAGFIVGPLIWDSFKGKKYADLGNEPDPVPPDYRQEPALPPQRPPARAPVRTVDTICDPLSGERLVGDGETIQVRTRNGMVSLQVNRRTARTFRRQGLKPFRKSLSTRRNLRRRFRGGLDLEDDDLDVVALLELFLWLFDDEVWNDECWDECCGYWEEDYASADAETAFEDDLPVGDDAQDDLEDEAVGAAVAADFAEDVVTPEPPVPEPTPEPEPVRSTSALEPPAPAFEPAPAPDPSPSYGGSDYGSSSYDGGSDYGGGSDFD